MYNDGVWVNSHSPFFFWNVTMFFDQMREVGGKEIFDIVPKSGDTFPDKNISIGAFFYHDYHGLCVFCHDGNWRKVFIT